jgi:hypothetical protein
MTTFSLEEKTTFRAKYAVSVKFQAGSYPLKNPMSLERRRSHAGCNSLRTRRAWYSGTLDIQR